MSAHNLEKGSHDPPSPLQSNQDLKELKIDIRSSSQDTEKPNKEVILDPSTWHDSPTNPNGETAESGIALAMDPRFEVDWEGKDDPENPLNWSNLYKTFDVFALSFSALIVVCYSTSYVIGIPQMMAEFNIQSTTTATLGLTTYLIGQAVGTLLVAPLSEMVGRRPVFLIGMGLYAILIIPAALGRSLTQIIVVRFFGAVAASGLVCNSPGALADISRLEHRTKIFSIWSLGPMQGPVIGPILGGFVTQYLGWRWTNWVTTILAGISFVLLFLMKETYAPTLLRQKAARWRQETGDSRYWSRYDSKQKLSSLLKTNLSRPFVMAFTEPICMFWNLYVGIIYAVLYLCFIAYPIVFGELRGWDMSDVGLSFLGIGVGQLIAICSEPLCRRLIRSHRAEADSGKPPLEAIVSVVMIGAVFTPIGQLWFAWTNSPPTHWIWPILAGIPFGFGNILIFIYATQYYTAAYGIYGASASAGNTVARSLLGALLPLAGPAMYRSLGVHWAASLCGFLALICIPIPALFYRYGEKYRKRSVMIRELLAEQERLEGGGRRTSGGAATASTATIVDTPAEKDMSEKRQAGVEVTGV